MTIAVEALCRRATAGDARSWFSTVWLLSVATLSRRSPPHHGPTALGFGWSSTIRLGGLRYGSRDMDQPADIFARDLLAAVGEVLLYWGYLEGAMVETLGDRPAAPALVWKWQTACKPSDETIGEIREMAAVRNLLAHGLCGVDARPRHGGEAEVVCRAGDGDLKRLTLGELRDTAQRLDLLRLSIDIRPAAPFGTRE